MSGGKSNANVQRRGWLAFIAPQKEDEKTLQQLLKKEEAASLIINCALYKAL